MDGYFCVAHNHKILMAKNDVKTLQVIVGSKKENDDDYSNTRN
jgi:hypothetical protein